MCAERRGRKATDLSSARGVRDMVAGLPKWARGGCRPPLSALFISQQPLDCARGVALSLSKGNKICWDFLFYGAIITYYFPYVMLCRFSRSGNDFASGSVRVRNFLPCTTVYGSISLATYPGETWLLGFISP